MKESQRLQRLVGEERLRDEDDFQHLPLEKLLMCMGPEELQQLTREEQRDLRNYCRWRLDYEASAWPPEVVERPANPNVLRLLGMAASAVSKKSQLG